MAFNDRLPRDASIPMQAHLNPLVRPRDQATGDERSYLLLLFLCLGMRIQKLRKAMWLLIIGYLRIKLPQLIKI